MDLYIGLGSNLGPREANIRRAISLLSSLVGPLVRTSGLIETDPVDMDSSHKFINAVAIFETRMHPTELIRKTQMLEKSLGREQKTKNGVHLDRTIDIDILQYGDLRIDVPGLTIPHPRMLTREFVLGPLAEVAPETESVLQPGYTFAQLYRQLLSSKQRLPNAQEGQDPYIFEELTGVTPEEFEQLKGIFAQLTDRPLKADAYVGLITSEQAHLYIEDVVVDKNHRGLGLGKRLLRFVHERAKELGVGSLILTSAPRRVEANGLYRSLGYELRDTNAYRLNL